MKKVKRRIKRPEGNSNLRTEWISAFEDLDRELERIIKKMDITPDQIAETQNIK